MRRALLWTILVAVVTGWTCSQQSGAKPGDDAGPPDAGPASDAGTDAGIACGDPLAPPELDCGTLSWAKSSATSRPRNHQFSFIAQSDAGAFLYVIGGVNGSSAGGVLANVDMAPIQQDGSLGVFAATTPLSIAVAGATGGLIGNVVVIAGGHGLASVTDESFSAIIESNGAIEPWSKAGSVLHPRMHGGAIAYGDTLYILGGFDGSTQVWSDVVSATVHPDGTLSAWVAAGALPQPLSHFSAALAGNRVYLTGGLNKSSFDNPPDLTNVYQGTIAADGTLGDWTDLTPLPTGISTHASFIYGGHLYVAGGIDNTPAYESRVWSAAIAADGSLGEWELVAALPIARGHVHQIPVLGNHLYSVAGAIDFSLDSTSEIDIGAFQ